MRVPRRPPSAVRNLLHVKYFGKFPDLYGRPFLALVKGSELHDTFCYLFNDCYGRLNPAAASLIVNCGACKAVSNALYSLTYGHLMCQGSWEDEKALD